MAPGAKVDQEAGVVLTMIRMCEKFNTLPRAGGILDQDGLFIYLVHEVMVFDGQRAELDRSKQASQTTKPR